MARECRLTVGERGRVQPDGVGWGAPPRRLRLPLRDELQNSPTIEWDFDSGAVAQRLQVARVEVACGHGGTEHRRRDVLDGGREHPGRRARRRTRTGRVDDRHGQPPTRGFERDREAGDPATEDEEIGG